MVAFVIYCKVQEAMGLSVELPGVSICCSGTLSLEIDCRKTCTFNVVLHMLNGKQETGVLSTIFLFNDAFAASNCGCCH